MIECPCPNCSRPLSLSDHLAGLSHPCPECGERFTVPDASFRERPMPRPAPAPRPRRPTALGRPPRRAPAPVPALQKYAWLILLAGLAVLGGGGYLAYQLMYTDVWVYVDNGGAEPLTVSIDGWQRTTVTPHTFALVKCRSGERRIQVTRGGAPVFDEVKQLRTPKRDVSKYLLNPEDTHGYRTYVVEYGMSFQLPNLAPLGGDFPLLLGDPETRVRSRFEELAKKPVLLESGPWKEISQCDFVFQREPHEVEGFIHDTRTVLTRIDKRDYARILEARKKTDPTAEDLEELEKVVDRVLAATP